MKSKIAMQQNQIVTPINIVGERTLRQKQIETVLRTPELLCKAVGEAAADRDAAVDVFAVLMEWSVRDIEFRDILNRIARGYARRHAREVKRYG